MIFHNKLGRFIVIYYGLYCLYGETLPNWYIHKMISQFLINFLSIYAQYVLCFTFQCWWTWPRPSKHLFELLLIQHFQFHQTPTFIFSIIQYLIFMFIQNKGLNNSSMFSKAILSIVQAIIKLVLVIIR